MNLISVIIVNWNGRRFLSQCLDALRNQAFKGFSTILVDNNSSDGSIDFVSRNYPEVGVVALHKNLGFSVANNIPLKTIQTEYVALLNNDTVADPLWLRTLVEALAGKAGRP